MTTNFNAAKLLMIKHIIANGTVEDLIKEIGIGWEVEPTLIDELELVQKTDISFIAAVNDFTQAVYLTEVELNTFVKKVQVYLADHPVRKHLINAAVQRKQMESRVVMVLDKNQLHQFRDWDKVSAELMEKGRAFIQVKEGGAKQLKQLDVYGSVKLKPEPFEPSDKVARGNKMSFEKFGRITIDEIRVNAPEGANLYWYRVDGDIVHKIVYYRLDKTGHLAFHADSDNTWPPCQNPAIIPQLKLLFE